MFETWLGIRYMLLRLRRVIILDEIIHLKYGRKSKMKSNNTSLHFIYDVNCEYTFEQASAKRGVPNNTLSALYRSADVSCAD